MFSKIKVLFASKKEDAERCSLSQSSLGCHNYGGTEATHRSAKIENEVCEQDMLQKFLAQPYDFIAENFWRLPEACFDDWEKNYTKKVSDFFTKYILTAFEQLRGRGDSDIVSKIAESLYRELTKDQKSYNSNTEVLLEQRRVNSIAAKYFLKSLDEWYPLEQILSNNTSFTNRC